MLSLVYKDFLLQRGTKSFVYMLVMPVISAFAFSSDVLYVILPYIAGSYLYIVYANALDDKYNAETLFNAMPVKRSSIIAAKYLGVFCYMIAFIAVITVLSFLIRIFSPDFNNIPPLSWLHIVQFIIIAAFYYGIFFPFYFKLGYQKSRWVNYISMILSAGVYATATKGLSAVVNIEISSLQAALEYITGIQSLIWSITLPLFAAAFIAVSVRLSFVFYSRRDF